MFNSDDFQKSEVSLGITSFGGITNHHIERGNMGFSQSSSAAVRAPKGTVFAQSRATPDHVDHAKGQAKECRKQ